MHNSEQTQEHLAEAAALRDALYEIWRSIDGGGNVVTFSEADTERYRAAIAAWNLRTPNKERAVTDNTALAQAKEALELAHTFIREGVEFGYIKDTTTPDWRKALRETRAALDALAKEQEKDHG